MDSRLAIRFCVKALLLLSAALLIWKLTPVARHYSSALASCADAVYSSPPFDGVMREVRVNEGEFALGVIVGGARETLFIASDDVTGNLCVLLALYLASPVISIRVFLRCLSAALFVLFGIHVLSLYLIARQAIAWRLSPEIGYMTSVIEGMGSWMYPLVVLLWAPYVLAFLGEQSRIARPRSRTSI